MNVELVAGRSCGTCDVCCVALTIEDPQLTKMQGYPCHNLQPGGGCAIYEARPQTCRGFHCGWRRLKWMPETLRPDASGVLVRLIAQPNAKAAGGQELGVVFTLLEARALAAPGLAEAVATAVASGIPAFLHIPGPPGYTSAQTPINAVLWETVMRRDKAGVLDILRQARDHAVAGTFTPLEDYHGPQETLV